MDNGSFSGLFTFVAVGAAGFGVLLIGALLVGVALVVSGSRRGRAAADPGDDALAALGYTPAGGKRWSQPVNRTKIVYQEISHPGGRGGGRWTVPLTRYNTLNLQVEERVNPARESAGTPFSTGVAAMEERFVTSSDRPAQCIALATNATVVRCMLAMPYLSMRIRGDELVFEDAEGRGLRKLLRGDPATAPAAKVRAAEKEIHQATLALATVILDALYTRSGTLFAEHR